MDNYKNKLIKEEPEIASILENISTPDSSSDLCQRIIFAAQKLPQQRRITFGEVLKNLIAEYMTPKPAMAFASMLVLGFMIGLSTPNSTIENSTLEITDFGSDIYMDGGLL